MTPGTVHRNVSLEPQSPPPARSVSIRPLAISAMVREALVGGDPVLQAVHRLGASLIVPGADDGAFVSRPGIGLLPAHVVARARDLDRAVHAWATHPGDRCSLHLDVHGVRTFRVRLTPSPAALQSPDARGQLAAVARWLRARPAPLGLGVTAAELLSPAGPWLERLVRLQAETRSPESVLRTLVGRGAGTTPAGDDLVVGALAHAWVTRGPAAPIVVGMRRLRPELASLTTAVGATYLRAATRGEFGSHLVAWVRALAGASRPRALARARRVAGHGATSGYDILAGFVGAAEAADAHARSGSPASRPDVPAPSSTPT